MCRESAENGQEFAVLAVGKDSAIDLGDSSLTFDGLGLGDTARLRSASTYA